MGYSTAVKNLINDVLAVANLRLDTLTASKRQTARTNKLLQRGHFGGPAFPVPASVSSFDPSHMVAGERLCREGYQCLFANHGQPSLYDPKNDYFSPADACVSYIIARTFRPRRWIEVGSGNSTKVVRQAIEDGKLGTELICVDPEPRLEVISIADQFMKSEVEFLAPVWFADLLGANDVLFIDSSHTVKTGGDVCHLFLNVIPRLRPGVLVHVHDVFLPYDYPAEWIERRWDFSEQYLVQVMLDCSTKFEVIWPGYYVQQCRPDIAKNFEFLSKGKTASLWLRVLDGDRSEAPPGSP